jgi:hypothetical protein
MTDGKSQERLDRIEELIAQMAVNTLASQQASDEYRVRFEQQLAASNERLNRIEQLVESNNRFLEAFSVELRGYIQAMDNMTQRQNGIIATSNQDRQDANARLGSIQRRVDAIARHLGVDG